MSGGRASSPALRVPPSGSPIQNANAQRGVASDTDMYENADADSPLMGVPAPTPRTGQRIRARAVAATFFIFWATFLTYLERQGFSVSVTEMARVSGVDENVKASILGAFFWGYTLMQIPGGALANRLGNSRALTFTFLALAVVNLLQPGELTGAVSVSTLIGCRVLIGVAQGALFPAIHAVLADLIPSESRSTLVSVASSGMFAGSAVALSVSPLVVQHAGSRVLFLAIAAMAGLWVCMWHVWSERVRGGPGGTEGMSSAPGSIPWKGLMFKKAGAACTVGNCAFSYVSIFMMNYLPSFCEKKLGTSLAGMGPIAPLAPFLAMFFCTIGGGWLASSLIQRWNPNARGVETSTVGAVKKARQAVNGAGFLLAAVGSVAMALSSDLATGLVSMCLTLGALGLSRGGWAVSHIDVAGRDGLAGVLMAVANTVAAAAGVVATSFTGAVLSASTSGEGGGAAAAGVGGGWSLVLGVNAVVCVIGAVLYHWWVEGGAVDFFRLGVTGSSASLSNSLSGSVGAVERGAGERRDREDLPLSPPVDWGGDHRE
uniref:Major facilitator superfamily (MFS) profile domain-containing protein n=1 Tax=Chromera velia CCMP2878 TaxID=1169474 RepID=A0A0G4I715_9ALVE|eukprot:Cvel_1932.t1-p1 / transcript=Cvel_1932.t1 / gene=Cvel_1932 / organism=Chromera_velia_CCMP2878 / gene_product=Probable anion transporter 5, putative / transcript_product=Probable anion transporter 5, putative / location=Cvel_scaffold72:143394-146425(+) / protein_length=544 / sequence_SO=supercontig / SO=protein_coding / is_pseudo=false